MCWSITKDPRKNKITLKDLYLIEIQNNNARFYNFSNPEAMKYIFGLEYIQFKVKPVSSLEDPELILFEAEMLQPFFEAFFNMIFERNGLEKDNKFDESDESDESEVKIYIQLYQDGTIGWVPNTECKLK